MILKKKNIQMSDGNPLILIGTMQKKVHIKCKLKKTKLYKRMPGIVRTASDIHTVVKLRGLVEKTKYFLE